VIWARIVMPPRLQLRGPVEHEVGQEGVEVGEVPMQNALGTARLVGDGPAGESSWPVPQQHAFRGVEQLPPRVTQMHPSWHPQILSHINQSASVA
jgi:hypothetical protein